MRKTNLTLHCGATAVSRDRITTVATPPRTTTWVPIPHDRLLTGVQTCLERAGLSVVTEAHGLTRDGNRYFGLLQVANGENAEDFGLVVGLRNSHDKSFPAGLAVGASVFVCDNLSFSGEVKLARKHTAHVERDLPQLIESAVGRLERPTPLQPDERDIGHPPVLELDLSVVVRPVGHRVKRPPLVIPELEPVTLLGGLGAAKQVKNLLAALADNQLPELVAAVLRTALILQQLCLFWLLLLLLGLGLMLLPQLGHQGEGGGMLVGDVQTLRDALLQPRLGVGGVALAQLMFDDPLQDAGLLAAGSGPAFLVLGDGGVALAGVPQPAAFVESLDLLLLPEQVSDDGQAEKDDDQAAQADAEELPFAGRCAVRGRNRRRRTGRGCAAAARLDSSAARRAGSSVSWQNRHFCGAQKQEAADQSHPRGRPQRRTLRGPGRCPLTGARLRHCP